MTDEKRTEEKKRVRFRPIHAIAEKVDTVDGKDILKIEVPLEDEGEVLREGYKRGNDKKDITNKIGDIDMDEKELESKFDSMYSRKMHEDKIRENIENIKDKTEEMGTKLGENLSKVENLGGKFEDLDEKFDKYGVKQEESCNGVLCLKNDMGKLSKDVESRFENVNKALEELTNRTKTSLCKGEKGCNAPIPLGSTFCPNCGRYVDEWPSLKNWMPYDKRK